MTVIRAQVVFNPQGGLIEDRVVNTFHFTGPADPDGALLNTIAEKVRDFYVTPAPAVPYPLSSLLGAQIADAGHEVRIYTLDQVTGDRLSYNEAPPEHVEAFSFVGDARGDTPGIPAEVAAVLTLRNNTVVGVPVARRRGRIYFGPLGDGTITGTSGGADATLAPSLRALIAAGNKLKADIEVAGQAWVIYSRPFGGRGAEEKRRADGTFLPALPARPGTVYPVEQVTLDNAVDIQRRRGRKATTKWTTYA